MTSDVRYAIDTLWSRSRDGRGLIAGSPPTWWKVTDAGARVLDALETGADLPSGHDVLSGRLLASGAIHPTDVAPVDASTLTIVIPVLARDDAAHRLLDELVARLAPIRTIVVDDGSPQPVHVAGATVVRHGEPCEPCGPGAARNSGLALVTTPHVAFVDADTHVSAGDLCRLAGHLADPRVALVAPRVTAHDGSPLSWYDAGRSPLDLGPSPALVRPFSRVSYVPSAVIVCDTASMQTAGGFDASFRWGEDVDLVWRLVRAGRWCRHDPSVTVGHDVRNGLRALLAQRYRYGSSAAPLATRHRDWVAPFRASVPLTFTAALFLTAWWIPAAVIGVATSAWYAGTLRRRGLSLRSAAKVAVGAVSGAVYRASTAVGRGWWPIAACASVVTWRAAVTLAIGFGLPALVDALRHRPSFVRLAPWCALHIADDVAYSLGVWSGALRTRSMRCLLPAISVPRRSAR